MSATGGRERGQDHGHAQVRHHASGVERDVKRAAVTSCPTADPGVPPARGMYDPALDKDSCGVGFIADIKGRKSHQIVADALTILVNLEHRGAVGADPRAGDGAGILTQIPHKFFAKKAAALGFTLPAPGEYAVGALFMPHDVQRQKEVADTYQEVIDAEGFACSAGATCRPTTRRSANR